MAKITYYLGAGASYHAYPILDKQAQMMIQLARMELQKTGSYGEAIMPYEFKEEEKDTLPNVNRIKILWHIGYFGKKAILFNTIDTYARKLELTGDITELDLLKMSVSVFFDLWSNFYESRYQFPLFKNPDDKIKEKKYDWIDSRYKSLFSILLEKGREKIYFNESIKFVTWNYDLQLESTFRLFQGEDKVKSFEDLNTNYFMFKGDNNLLQQNNVFHLNGHHGFYSDFSFSNLKKQTIETGSNNSIDDYWKKTEGLFDSTMAQTANFNKYVKYAWEHDLNSDWFQQISTVMKETEILVVIGYSFPPFNREIDQELFSKLNPNKIKKIVYQDPSANKQIIKNLFKTPGSFENKIEIETGNLNQFYLPNEHFITQKTPSYDIR